MQMTRPEVTMRIEHMINKILEATGSVTIRTNTCVNFRITKQVKLTYDTVGVFLEDDIYSWYQTTCKYTKVYVPYDNISAITDRGV